MATLTPAQIGAYARGAGFTGTGLRWAIAVALAESGGRTDARHVNTGGSVDRGLWQINNRAHPDVSDATAYDPAGCARAAYAISAGGTNWRPWSTYTNGSAGAQMARATSAATVTTAGLTDPGVPVPGLGTLPVPWVTGGAQAAAGAAGVFDGIGRVAAIIGSVVAKAASWLSDSHNWLRILFVVAGSAATLAGLVMLSNSGVGGPVGSAGSVVSKAGTALPAGRAVKIARTLAK